MIDGLQRSKMEESIALKMIDVYEVEVNDDFVY